MSGITNSGKEHFYRGYPVGGFDAPPHYSWQARQVELGGRLFPQSLKPGDRLQSSQELPDITGMAMGAMIEIEQLGETTSDGVQ